MGDEAIHAGHCSRYACLYGDPNCPVVEVNLPGGKAEQALTVLRDVEPCMELPPICGTCGFRHPEQPVDTPTADELAQQILVMRVELDTAQAALSTTTVEYAVRGQSEAWVYALPRLIPKFLYGKRGTREAAEWHRRQIAGPDPEDWTGFEIVHRPVGPWEVVS